MVSSKNNQTQQSAPMNITTLKNELKAIFDHQSLPRLAGNTGFTRRLRNLSPLHFICAIVQTLGTQPKANLADIHRCLGAISGTMPNYKPFHNQMKKKALATFLQKLVERAQKSGFSHRLKPLYQRNILLSTSIYMMVAHSKFTLL